MHSRLISVLAGATIAVGLATQAQATFFSFASDSNPSSFTFAGTAGNSGSFLISDYGRPNTFSLLIDDDNGPLPAIPLAVEFHASLTASAGQSVNIGGTRFLHMYDVTGSFGFFDADGNALLTANVGPNAGSFIVPGSANEWSTTGAVLGADSYADVTYTVTQRLVDLLGGDINAAKYGIVVGSSGTGSNDDFGFDLSVIGAATDGSGITLDQLTRTPTSAWRSESSFSGSTTLPGPGMAGALGAIGLASIRRRR
jgi:hypothetical protein